MARKRNRSKPQRRNPKTMNLLPIAESYLLANVITREAFNSNPIEFLTGWSRNNSSGSFRYSAGRDGATVLTLPEIITGINVGNFTGASPTALGIAKYNLEQNGNEGYMKLVAGMVGIPIAFRVGSKLLRKPRTQLNKVIKMTGLGVRL